MCRQWSIVSLSVCHQLTLSTCYGPMHVSLEIFNVPGRGPTMVGEQNLLIVPIKDIVWLSVEITFYCSLTSHFL